MEKEKEKKKKRKEKKENQTKQKKKRERERERRRKKNTTHSVAIFERATAGRVPRPPPPPAPLAPHFEAKVESPALRRRVAALRSPPLLPSRWPRSSFSYTAKLYGVLRRRTGDTFRGSNKLRVLLVPKDVFRRRWPAG